MKKNISGISSVVPIVLLCSLVLSCGSLLGPTIPGELIGTWSATGAYSYVEEFTFTSSKVTYYGYSQTYPGEFDASWDRTLKELYEEDEIIQLDNDMYLAYHISGSTLYLYKTNPYADYPDLPSDWWDGTTTHYTLYKE